MNHDEYLALRRFESLDGLRAVSVLAVIWQHTASSAFPATSLAYVGNYGVILFFAISGFLITTLLLRERERHGRIDLRAFYVRRALRIFPIFYVTLAVYVALVWLVERDSVAGREFFHNLPAFATYTSNWLVEQKERTIFYFAWSLATEEQYYLVWPPLLVALGTRQRATVAMAAFATAVLVFHTWLGTLDQPKVLSAWYQRLPLAISAGSLLALLLHAPAGLRALAPWLGHRLASAVLAAVLALVALWPGVPETAAHVVSALLVASVCMQPRHVLRRLLGWRPLAYLGTISYGMYLLHNLAHHASSKVMGRLGIAGLVEPGWLIGFMVTTLVTVAVAGASFRWFESPLLNLKHRYER